MGRSLDVLVVDDEMVVALAIESVLTGEGHTPLVAAGVQEALMAAARAPHLDLAILDLQLRDGAGAGLVAALRERWPGLPVVISTGYALDAEDRASIDPAGGPSLVLKKPWSEAQLLAAIATATGPLRSRRQPVPESGPPLA